MKKQLGLAALILSNSFVQAQVIDGDTLMHARDSAVVSPEQYTVGFFQVAEKAADPSKLRLVTKAGKTTSLADLLAITEMKTAEHGLADLDNDGKKELLIYKARYDVKGPDEIWFYKNIATLKYQYAGKLINGHTAITARTTFSFNVKEFFEEFYSCYGCGYDDHSDEAPIKLQEVELKYVKGKIVIQKGDQEMRSIINDNLGKLAEKLTPLSADGKDDGTRKEIAINLAVFYYCFGKNLAETQRLFLKYYKQPDAKKVWAKWLKQQQIIASQNSF